MNVIERRQAIEQEIKERATEYFKRDKSGKGYICPICGSGSGTHGTGITENPKSKGHFTCWAGCFQNADIFEIIGKQFNLTDFNEIFIKACELFNISLDESYTMASTEPRKSTLKERREDYSMSENKNQNKAIERTNFTEFYKQAEANLGMTDYYRGLGLETLKRFHVGFMPQWRVKENAPTSPRLIIPINESCYLARDTRAELTETQAQYKKMRQGKISLFNAVALTQDKEPVFITEGEIDALSIIDAGGQAIALCGIKNVNKLITTIKDGQVKARLIIALDNDRAGQEAVTKLEQALKEANFFLYRLYQLPNGYKDANEFLMNDRVNFAEWVKNGQNLFNEINDDFEREAVSFYLNDFLQEIQRNRDGQAIATGFENLDTFFDGGFYPGLYFLGANSSTGKTSFLLQIADNIAQAGHGVLFFSLEMSRNELIARSLSRMSLLKSMSKKGTTKYAKTTRGVLLGRYNNVESEFLTQALKEYSDFGHNLHISEGVGNIGITQIKNKILEYIQHKGTPPIVVIDYIQILAPYDMHMTDKQNTDKNVLELKRLSRDFQIPVIGISSFNRENYKTPVSMASFKESGAIEYSSDVLLGAQYYGWDYKKGGEKEPARLERLSRISEINDAAAKAGKSLKIQVKILKNRNGSKGSVFFDFYPMFNYFNVSLDNGDCDNQ